VTNRLTWYAVTISKDGHVTDQWIEATDSADELAAGVANALHDERLTFQIRRATESEIDEEIA
jgi:hypothetical protein